MSQIDDDDIMRVLRDRLRVDTELIRCHPEPEVRVTIFDCHNPEFPITSSLVTLELNLFQQGT